MVDKIEMSLDDIIKTTKKPGRGGPGGKGGFKRNNGQRGQAGGPGRGGPGARRPTGGSPGGILKGRNRGGSDIQKAKFNRSRVKFPF